MRYDLAYPMARIRFINGDKITLLGYVVWPPPRITWRFWSDREASIQMIQGMTTQLKELNHIKL